MLQTGRLPRTFDPSIVNVAKLRSAVPLPPLPVTLNNATKLPSFVGMMQNDQLGDCTVAAIGHLIQLWTENVTGVMLTEPDSQIIQAYEEVGGYRPGDISTDIGANEQNVLRWWQTTGFPLTDGTRLKIGPVFEANPQNIAGLCELIWQFGSSYIGFNVPDGFMEDLPPLWIDKPEYGPIVSGHCVLLHSFDRTDPANVVFGVTSWGTNRQFLMREDFLKRYVDEAYGIVSPLWADNTGVTPYGLDLATLAIMGSQLGSPLT